ncbi:MAG: hypothetical protein VKI83_05565 [Synechococcaceae cyanobacterium]|nr:hypothetical protein [Synechococcaceae cyanobacterium]
MVSLLTPLPPGPLVGRRLSPFNSFNGMVERDPIGLATWLAEMLNACGLAHLHLMRGDFLGRQHGLQTGRSGGGAGRLSRHGWRSAATCAALAGAQPVLFPYIRRLLQGFCVVSARVSTQPALVQALPGGVALLPGLWARRAQAQVDPHLHHHHPPQAPAALSAPASQPAQPRPAEHADHSHELGPAGASYDLRWLDAMVQQHTGALRMSEFGFNAGAPDGRGLTACPARSG